MKIIAVYHKAIDKCLIPVNHIPVSLPNPIATFSVLNYGSLRYSLLIPHVKSGGGTQLTITNMRLSVCVNPLLGCPFRRTIRKDAVDTLTEMGNNYGVVISCYTV